MVSVSFGTLAWLSGIPVVSMVAGMLLVQFVTPGKKLEALFQHFGAGVVMCAVATEILPILLQPEHYNTLDLLAIFLGFFIGVGLMLVIARAIPTLNTPENLASTEPADVEPADVEPVDVELTEAKSPTPPPKKHGRLFFFRVVPWGLVVPVSTDAMMDGLLIGISFVAGSLQTGLIMSIALSIEMCFLGVTTSVSLRKNKVPKQIGIPIGLALPQLILGFAFAGASILASLSGPLFEGVLSFGLAALLFLITDELLVEAHRHEEADTWWITAFFFLGFALVIALQVAAALLNSTNTSSTVSTSVV